MISTPVLLSLHRSSLASVHSPPILLISLHSATTLTTLSTDSPMSRYRPPDAPHIIGPHPYPNLDFSTPPRATRRLRRVPGTPEQWNKPDPEETPPHGPPWFWACPAPTTPVRFGSETELERVRLESPGAERKRGRESGSPSPTSRKRRREGSSSRRDGRRSSGIRDKGQDLDGDKDRGADTPPPDEDSDDESVIFLGWGSATPPASPPPAGPPASLPALPPARGGLFLPSKSESEADDDEVQIFEVEEVEEEVVPIEVSDDEDSDEFPDVDLPR